MTKRRLWASDAGLPINFWIARIARKYRINLNWIYDPKTSYVRRYPLRLSDDRNVTRRLFIIGLPATGASWSLPVPISAKTPTPVIRLFRQWEQALIEANGVSEEDCDMAVKQMAAIERQMLAVPSANMADLAAKIIAFSSWGALGLPEREHELWAEMRTMISAT